jgi:hypothetical protein
VGALFLALSATAVEYSQTARYVGPSLCLAAAAGWALVALARRPHVARLAVFLGLLVVGVLTNLLLLVLVPLVAGWALIAWRMGTGDAAANARRLRVLLVAGAGALLAMFTLFSLPFATEWLADNARFAGHPGSVKMARTLVFAASTVARTDPAVFALGLAGAWLLARERGAAGQAVALLALGPVAVLFALSPMAYTPARYIVFVLPAACVAAGYFVVTLSARLPAAARLAPWAVGAAACLSLVLATGDYLHTGGGRNGLRDAYRLVAQRMEPGLLVATTVHTKLAARIWGVPVPDADQVLLVDESGEWLTNRPDRGAWVILHSSFDPVYQQVRPLSEVRCRHRATFPAQTLHTPHWVEVHRCWPLIPPEGK